MTRDQAMPYVSFCIDDALGLHTLSTMPADARLVGWQCGFEPLFVAVWSYLGCRLDESDAVEIATDYLAERGWFGGEPSDPDYVL